MSGAMVILGLAAGLLLAVFLASRRSYADETEGNTEWADWILMGWLVAFMSSVTVFFMYVLWSGFDAIWKFTLSLSWTGSSAMGLLLLFGGMGMVLCTGACTDLWIMWWADRPWRKAHEEDR